MSGLDSTILDPIDDILEGTDPGSNPDIPIIDPGDGEGGGGGGVIIIGGGDAAADVSYDVVSIKTTVGASYIASQNGSMTVSNSVSCLSRVSGFLASNTSSMKVDCCAASATNYGFVASLGSSQRIAHSTTAVCTTGYYLDRNSVQNVHYSAVIFPFRQGVYARGASTFSPVEFEIMTKYVNPNVFDEPPVMFQSGGNAYVQNNSQALSRSETQAGFSGEYITTSPISFIWVEFKQATSINATLSNGNDERVDASYRYVPLPHSLDYSNVVNASSNSSGNGVVNNLIPLIAHRSNYFSVKPPAGLTAPEDGSGSRATNALTSTYSLNSVIFGDVF